MDIPTAAPHEGHREPRAAVAPIPIPSRTMRTVGAAAAPMAVPAVSVVTHGAPTCPEAASEVPPSAGPSDKSRLVLAAVLVPITTAVRPTPAAAAMAAASS